MKRFSKLIEETRIANRDKKKAEREKLCPPGYTFNTKTLRCEPNTSKDDVSKTSGEGNKGNFEPGTMASFNTIGSHGQNGAPYAYEEPATVSEARKILKLKPKKVIPQPQTVEEARKLLAFAKQAKEKRERRNKQIERSQAARRASGNDGKPSPVNNSGGGNHTRTGSEMYAINPINGMTEQTNYDVMKLRIKSLEKARDEMLDRCETKRDIQRINRDYEQRINDAKKMSEEVAAGDGGFTSSADAKGPVAGYDSLMTKSKKTCPRCGSTKCRCIGNAKLQDLC